MSKRQYAHFRAVPQRVNANHSRSARLRSNHRKYCGEQDSSSSPVSSSAAPVLAGTVVSGVLNYLYVIFLTHLLPPLQYERFAGSQALLLITGTVANSAVPWVLSQDVRRAADGSERRSALTQGLLANLFLGSIGATTCVAVASDFLPAPALAALAAGVLGFFLASTTMGWAQGRGRYGILGLLVGGEVAVKTAMGIALVKLGAGLAGAVGAAALGAAAVVVVAVAFMGSDRRLARPRSDPRRMWQSSAGMAALQGLLSLAIVLDAIFVSTAAQGSSAAAYQLASTIGRAPVFLGLAVATTIYPALHKDSPAADRHQVASGLALVVSLSSLAWATLATLPAQLARLAPGAYSDSLRFLIVTAASGVLWSCTIYLSCCLRGAGHLRWPALTITTSILLGVAAMIIAYLTFGLWGVAVAEFLAASFAITAVTIIATRLWTVLIFLPLRRSLPWILAIGPLVLLRREPATWLLAVGLASLACLAASFPELRRRVILR